jgi:hypothetical protein
MSRQVTLRIRTAQRAALGCLAILVMACGGGSGGGDSSSASSEGPISGFGSVIMNGVRWNTDSAKFDVDGRVGSQDDLDVGMVVRIEGRRRSDGRATADRVIFESRLRGPIRQIDEIGPDTRVLHIFGLRAFVSRADTRFKGTTLDGLQTDTVVEVSGLVNADGDIEAMHLRSLGVPVVGATEVKLSGEIEGLAGGSFMIATSEVLFDSDTELDDLGPGGLRDGLEVRVEGILLANDAIDASEIEGPRHDRDDDFDEIEIQGIVSDFVSLADFRVADRPVDASGARLEPNDPDLLRDGVRVEAEGRINSAGVLIAEKLKFKSNRVRIHAEVANDLDVDAIAGEISMLDILITVDGATRIRDGRDGLDGFGLADIVAGDFLEIRGIARSDGSVTATRLEREDHNDLELRGPVDMIDAGAGEFTILGVLIKTDSATRFERDEGGIVSQTEFFDRLIPGSVVEAEDEEDGDETRFDVADEVEIEEPELEDRDDDDDDDDNDEVVDG